MIHLIIMIKKCGDETTLGLRGQSIAEVPAGFSYDPQVLCCDCFVICVVLLFIFFALYVVVICRPFDRILDHDVCHFCRSLCRVRTLLCNQFWFPSILFEWKRSIIWFSMKSLFIQKKKKKKRGGQSIYFYFWKKR